MNRFRRTLSGWSALVVLTLALGSVLACATTEEEPPPPPAAAEPAPEPEPVVAEPEPQPVAAETPPPPMLPKTAHTRPQGVALVGAVALALAGGLRWLRRRL